MKTTALIAILVFMTAASVIAADFQWPAQMTIGGFQVTGISGRVNPNGSGSANGTIQIPSMGNANVSLTRTSRGDVSGTASLDARVSGGTLRGSFTLSNGGLKGRGAAVCYSRSIDNADISIDRNGEARGNGRLSVGRLGVQVDFTASGSSCSVSGETPVRVQVDTPIASYKFDGRLAVRTSGGSVSATITGRVERTGKLSNQVTSFNIPNTNVDLSNGQCAVNVGGVSVTFSL